MREMMKRIPMAMKHTIMLFTVLGCFYGIPYLIWQWTESFETSAAIETQETVVDPAAVVQKP
jgi:hypothetical protein